LRAIVNLRILASHGKGNTAQWLCGNHKNCRENRRLLRLREQKNCRENSVFSFIALALLLLLFESAYLPGSALSKNPEIERK
jgi:hypothetical protein